MVVEAGLAPLQIKVVLSAYCRSVPALITDGKVFIYTKNKRGPKALPCGMPPLKMKINFDI